jgi:DNA-binding beta-propeller fold protein YncE
MGIAIDRGDNVYVADNGNERIQKFDSGFTHVDIWSGPQGPDGFGIRLPYGIVIGPGGNVYVADGGILKFKPDGTFLKGWRGGPTNDLPFAAAQLAFDQDGNLFVVDRYEHRVQKFDPSDTFVAAFGELGAGPGELDEPFGITIDFQGRAHVADSHNNRVQVFDRDGRFLFGWGSEQLTYPEWLGVDKQGNILVTGRYMMGVQKFKVKGPSL